MLLRLLCVLRKIQYRTVQSRYSIKVTAVLRDILKAHSTEGGAGTGPQAERCREILLLFSFSFSAKS